MVKTSFSFWKSSDKSVVTQLAVNGASSASRGIAQEETNGDALSLLSFSQRSIGFVALTHSYPTHFVLENFPSKFMSQVVN